MRVIVKLKPILRYTPWIILIVTFVTLCTINTQYKYTELSPAESLELEYSGLLDGCYHVYLDVGSNLGIQVRKLFEPSLYPKAKINRYFNILFGNDTVRKHELAENDKYICAIGFEPNSKLSSYLREIESSYNKCGWRVKFLTETAVSDHYESAQFYSDGEYHKYEWGGGILPHALIRTAKDSSVNDNYEKVNVIRLGDFLKYVVGKRRIPKVDKNSSRRPPRVVMKIDIEGSEIEVIPDLLFSGGLEFVNILMMEWHGFIQLKEERKQATKILENIIDSMSNYSRIMEDELGTKHAFRLLNVDDETYHISKYDLPKC